MSTHYKILKLYAQGHKRQDIAEMLGVSHSLVKVVIRTHGYDSPTRAWTSGCRLILELYLEEGFPLDTIAKMLRRPGSLIRDYCDRHGIAIPEPTKKWAVCNNQGGGGYSLFRAFETRREAERYNKKYPKRSKVVDLRCDGDQLQTGS